MNDPEIRVLFLDDDRGVSEGVARTLQDHRINVVGFTATVDETVLRSASEPVDVIVADIDLVGTKALHLPAVLPPDGPPVLWWSGHDSEYRLAARLAGGAGFVAKREAILNLVDAIRRAAKGKTSWTLADERAKTEANRLPRPSPRELEVLHGIAEGKLSKEIAAGMGISERSVETHLRNMYVRYLDADKSNRSALRRFAERLGWI